VDAETRTPGNRREVNVKNVQTKSGVVAFGNWIVDKIAMVDRAQPFIDPVALRNMIKCGSDVQEIIKQLTSGNLGSLKDVLVHPIVTEGQLTPISSVGEGTGGAPYNVLIDIAKLGVNIPLGAVGIIGKDGDGEYIWNDLKKHMISADGMIMRESARTSFTNVYQPRGGNRGFAHYSAGTNDELSDGDIEANLDFIGNFRYCHAGYVLLLAALDAKDEQYGTKMARALKLIRDRGVKTSLAVVSNRDVARFKETVIPSLQFADIHMPNEYEATHTTGIEVRDRNSARDAAKKLFNDFGVKDVVVIHMGENGSLGMLRDGTTHYQPVHKVTKIEVTAGAGDAFEAGFLYALHQNKGLEYGMRLGTAMAAICLGGRSCTDSMQNLEYTENLMNTLPYKK
jgi:sugar/nucleoside kinase (ribokinase family)